MVYLDNAAKTIEFFHRSDYKCFFNSNMPYAKKENCKLDFAREKIKNCLNVKNGKIIFFRCATDIAEWLHRNLWIETSSYEHDSIFLNSQIDCNCYSHQLVNQMTGTIYNLEEIAKHINDKNNTIFCYYDYFISDITAAIGHINLPKNLESFCDAVWFDGIKFHTEGNIAALWINNKLARYFNASENSHNQYNILHGTVDVSGACMLADAMESSIFNFNNLHLNDIWKEYSDKILYKLNSANIKCKYVANDKNRTYAINALQFEKIDGDALSSYLASKSIYVGKSSSACAEENDYRVLNAYGLTDEEASNVIRISFASHTKSEEIDEFIKEVINFYNTFC